MAKPRAILNRANSIKNIAKITGTMEKIATARFKKAHKRAVAARPYTDRLTALIQELSAAASSFHHPLLEAHDEEKKVVLLGVGSNRGLCGGYNSNIARKFHATREALVAEGKDVRAYVAGKRIIGMLRYRGVPFENEITHIDDRPTFEQVDAIATPVMDAFVTRKIDALYVVYTKYHSATRHSPVAEQILPLARPAASEQAASEQAASGEAESGKADVGRDWIFSPDPETILAELLPRSVRLKVFQAFLDAGVSEQSARKVAMKNATDNANDLIKFLTQKYNRSRQALITTELSEIIGGAAAMS